MTRRLRQLGLDMHFRIKEVETPSRDLDEVNMATEPPLVQQPLLESSSGMDKLQCINIEHISPDTKIIAMGLLLLENFDGEFQLTEPWSAKIRNEEAQKCNTLFPRSSAKKFSEQFVQKILEHP